MRFCSFAHQFVVFGMGCICCLTPVASFGSAVGVWDMRVDFPGEDIASTLIVEEQADGTLAGSIKSRPATVYMDRINYSNGRISFSTHVALPEVEMEVGFKGFIRGEFITGIFSTAMGDMNVTGMRRAEAGAPVDLAGVWEIDETSGDMYLARIAIEEDAAGTFYVKDEAYPIANVTIDGEDIAFTVTGERAMEFTGSITDSGLEGSFARGDESVATIRAEQRVLGDVTRVAGTWKLSVDGDREHTLRVTESGETRFQPDAGQGVVTAVGVTESTFFLNAMIGETPFVCMGMMDGDKMTGSGVGLDEEIVDVTATRTH